MDKNFEICARAIIIKNGKILLCHSKGKNHFFFPGGQVDFGEKTEAALAREIKEEIGAVISNLKFIGTVENYFSEADGEHHEINIAFSGEIDLDEVAALESHLDFAWKEIPEFSQMAVLPQALKKSVLKWIEDKNIFWSSQF